jgi:hypothetical protein
MGDMVAPLCSTSCGAQSAAAVAAAIAAESGCCPVRCATVFTEGDTLTTVPEFDIAVEDLQLVEVTVTGYVVKLEDNVDGIQGGFVYFRGMARRFDGDDVLPGLAVLLQNTTLQSLSAGLATAFNVSGNTLQFQLDGAAGTYRWDLEMQVCVRDQLVDVIAGGG